LIRDKKFISSSINKINRRSVEGATQISFAFIPLLKKTGLFAGDILGNFVYFLSAFYQSFKAFKIDFRFFKPALLKHIAKEYSDLPKYNIIPELLNTGFFAAISFLVLSKFNIKEVGYMELTQRILAIPSAFISFSIGQVLLQKITELVNNKQKITGEIKKVFLLLLAMTIPFVLIIIFFAVPLFKFVFGDEWAVSGLYSKYLVVFYAFGFMISPLSQVLISLQKFKLNAVWKIGRFFVILPLFFIDFDKIDTYLLSYSGLGVVSYIVYFIIIFNQAKKFDNKL
jgi:O-antigen/teichoic acid export membrane protein